MTDHDALVAKARAALELAEEAPTGPWLVVNDDHHPYRYQVQQVNGWGVVREDDGGLDRPLCEFISAARTDIPELANAVISLVDENRRLSNARLERTNDMAYDLLQRMNKAVQWLREVEDIARMGMPAWPTADRIREIYEQISDDVLNGRSSVPPLKQRLSEAENENRRLQAAFDGLRTDLFTTEQDTEQQRCYTHTFVTIDKCGCPPDPTLSEQDTENN